jgi:hypothetical protein
MPLAIPNQPASFNNHFGSVGQNFQASHQHFVECGAEIQDLESFLEHFNSQHRPFLANVIPNLPRASVETHHNHNSHHQPMADAPSQSTSPPATPLDTSDSGRSSGTPSPLTPLSNNNVEMTDVKPGPAPSLARSMSIASSADQSLEPGSIHDEDEDDEDDEHRCLWRDEGRPNVCGLVFANAEDLFKHASEAHVKHAQKGAQGFRCGWDDCPRSDPNAPGFPQRSKIERHMQTHIGR